MGTTETEQPVACLSVVMPAYNEAPTIARIAAQVLASPYTAELIIVDDGSTDTILSVARQLTDPRLTVIAQHTNQGKGAALRREFAKASAPYVVVQDADLEYNPEEYPQLLGALLDGKADVVYGNRFDGSRPHRVLYFWHAVGNRALTTASNMFTNLNLSDMETCYKVFRLEVIKSFVIEENRLGFEPEITAKVAKGGWRVYEIGISYSGRTYAEGKKISWKDGVRAIYCIIRYSLGGRRDAAGIGSDIPAPVPFGEADEELQSTLHSLDGAKEYTDWIYGLVQPHIGAEVLEVGAGHGSFTARFAATSHVTATDISATCIASLRQRFEGDHRVEVLQVDLAEAALTGQYDSVVLINVLENIEDDVKAMSQLAGALKPDGRLVLWVPAFPQLYSDFDRRVGHHRRYRIPELRRVVGQAGLDLVDIRYVNLVGSIAWWIVAKKLGRVPTTTRLVRLFDRAFVPVLRRLESGREPIFGQSIFCVARNPADPRIPGAPE